MAEPRRIYGSHDLSLEVSEVGNLSTGAVGQFVAPVGCPSGLAGTFYRRPCHRADYLRARWSGHRVGCRCRGAPGRPGVQRAGGEEEEEMPA
jgi:hypothetical protein